MRHGVKEGPAMAPTTSRRKIVIANNIVWSFGYRNRYHDIVNWIQFQSNWQRTF